MWRWDGASHGPGSSWAQPGLRLPLQPGAASPAFLPVFRKIKLSLWSSLPHSWGTDGTSRRMDLGLSPLIARDLRLVSAKCVTAVLLPLMLWLLALYWQHLGCMVCAQGVHAICAASEGLLHPKAVAGSWKFTALLGVVGWLSLGGYPASGEQWC